MKKTITKQELIRELKTLKNFGLTDEEIEGYVDYYYKNKIRIMVNRSRVLNNIKRKCNVN